MTLHLIEPGRKASVPLADTFTGDGWRDELLPLTDRVRMGNVTFTPCARTDWHRHEGGQLLIVISGVGVVATEDDAVRLSPGRMVWTPPGQRHWHGASACVTMVHTTVSLGEVEWQEPVTGEVYQAAIEKIQAGPRY